MKICASKLVTMRARSPSVRTQGTNCRSTYSFHTWNVVTRRS